MGLLADIGRSRAVSSLTGGVLENTQGLLKTRMAMDRMAEESRSREIADRMGMAQLQEYEQKTAELNRRRPFEESVLYQMAPEEDRPKLLEIARRGGYLDENGTMSMRDRNQMMNESKEFMPFWISTQKVSAQQSVEKSIAAFQKAQLSGDKDAIAKSESEMRANLARLAGLNDASDKVAKILGIDKEDKTDLDKDLLEFEQLNPQMVQMRGTADYQKAFYEHKKKMKPDSQAQYQEEYVQPLLDNWKAANPNATPEQVNAKRAQIYIEGQKDVARAQATAAPTLQDIGPTQGTEDQRTVFNTKTGQYEQRKGPRTLPRTTSPIAGGDLKNLSDVFNSLRLLDTMEKYVGKTGIIKGKVNQAGAYVGTDPDAQKFDAAQKQFKLSAQSMIKGIPSNFDVETMIDTLPSFGLPENMNRQRIKQSRELGRAIASDAIAYYKSANKTIPQFLIDRAKSMGIDPGSVNPWDGDKDPLSTAISITEKPAGAGGGNWVFKGGKWVQE